MHPALGDADLGARRGLVQALDLAVIGSERRLLLGHHRHAVPVLGQRLTAGAEGGDRVHAIL